VRTAISTRERTVSRPDSARGALGQIGCLLIRGALLDLGCLFFRGALIAWGRLLYNGALPVSGACTPEARYLETGD
jgi:hypothetical protein